MKMGRGKKEIHGRLLLGTSGATLRIEKSIKFLMT